MRSAKASLAVFVLAFAMTLISAAATVYLYSHPPTTTTIIRGVPSCPTCLDLGGTSTVITKNYMAWKVSAGVTIASFIVTTALGASYIRLSQKNSKATKQK